MDPLALLSNLHGDGPATLQRLRRRGYDTLSGLLAAPADELASALGWDGPRAERLLREAESLARRLGEGLLEREDEAEAPAPARAEAPPRGDARVRVLERWRELDAVEPVRDVITPQPRRAPPPAGTALVEGALDGLDAARIQALSAAGVTTLEELARLDDLELHRRAGLAFSLASRLAFLARRRVASRASAPAGTSLAERELDAAGPFA